MLSVTEGDNTQADQRSVVSHGAGPAGLTAALYAAWANLDPRVVQGAAPDGQRITTTAVEHDPGFTEGILGPALIERSVREAVAISALPALDPVITAQTVVASCEGVMLLAKTQHTPLVIMQFAHGAVALVEAAVGTWLSPQHGEPYGTCGVVSSHTYIHARTPRGLHVGARSSDGTGR